MSINPVKLRNLLRGNGGIARGRGPAQRKARRVLLAAGGEASVTYVMDWLYARQRMARRELPGGYYSEAAKCLRAIGAVRVRRLEEEPGQPWLWRLPEDAMMGRVMGKKPQR
jgi:hypothetical protein